jgi:hypothetical protein
MGRHSPVSSISRTARRLLVTALVLAGTASAAPAQAAAEVPQVTLKVATQVTQTGATVEAAINPEGSETGYEIWLECQSAEESKDECEPLTVAPQRHLGTLPAGTEAQTVTAAMSGLQPGYLYEYGVIATNSGGREGYLGNGFLTCPSAGSCPDQPWLPGQPLWSIEGARRAAEEAPALEAERQARQREIEERPAKEAAARAALERAAREAGERAGREAAERAAAARAKMMCVVPRLTGDSLSAARRSLAKAHCVLGKVKRPPVYHGALVVGRQSVPRGRELGTGARVALTLRPKHD